MLIALLLFLPTLFFGSIFWFLLPALINMKKMELKDFQTPVFKIILIISVFSVTNFVLTWAFGNIQYEDSNSALPIFPYALLFIPTYIIAKTLDRKVLIWLLIFICLEIIIGIFEYIFGVTSFFTVTANEFGGGFGGEEMFYNKRVLGLSENSSGLSLKCLIGLIILYLTKPKYTIWGLLLLMAGLFITFNRSAILAVAPLLIYFYWYYIRGLKFKFIWIGLTIGVFLYLFSAIYYQFLRGADVENISVIASKRDLVFESFFSFFKEHIWNGNGSVKIWLELLPDKKFHAHNSLLMTLASNGILIFGLYLYFVFRFIKKNILIPIFSILIYSLFQYGILWGCSLLDIFFVFLLINCNLSNLSISVDTKNKNSFA